MTPRDPPWPEGTDDAQALAQTTARADLSPPVGAQTRVWQRVSERHGRRRSLGGWRWLLAAGGLACAGLLVWRPWRAPESLTIASAPLRSWTDAQRQLIELPGGTRVVVGVASDVALVEDDAHGMVLDLRRGSVLAEVAHRAVTAPFIVRTPRAEVKVVGTVLWVDVAAGGETTVNVTRGIVEVTPRGGAPVRVGAGERWPVTSSRVTAPADLALLTPAPSPITSASPCAGLAPTAAEECLAHTAREGDPLHAENALYELGWRALKQRGDARAALASWEQQRTRFPAGMLRLEADVSIIEALVKLDERAQARVAIDAFLAAHGDALAAPEVHYLRGSLARRAGDCASAIPDLDAALRAPAEPWATQARNERSACSR